MIGSTDAFPRLLVVAEFGPTSGGGGGALARQMLRGYPIERISWWNCVQAEDAAFHQPVEHQFTYAIPPRLIPHFRATRVKAAVLERVWSPLAARHLRATIRRVQPDVVWTILFGWALPVIAAAFREPLQYHASLWDSPITLPRQKMLGPTRAKRMVQSTYRLFAAAKTSDVICRPMQEEFERRTGRRADTIIHSGIEPEHLESLRLNPPLAPRSGSDIKIAFAGTVIERAAFVQVIDAMNDVRSRLGTRLRLEFFGANNYRQEPWFDPSWMNQHPHLSEENFMTELKTCSWGLVIMGLTDENPEYNRFSFPNKVGSYIAAGLPILSFGHPSSSIAQMMAKWHAGAHCAASAPTELSRFLSDTLSEPTPKLKFREAVLQCAGSEFDVARMRQELWKCFGGPRSM